MSHEERPTASQCVESHRSSDVRRSPVPWTESSEPAETKVKKVWKFHLRPDNDDEPQDWWIASKAIPLLAATLGPLANVMSIAALITSWRNNYDVNDPGVDALSVAVPDPRWCISLNAVSLVCGFVGNLFLLLNFTKRDHRPTRSNHMKSGLKRIQQVGSRKPKLLLLQEEKDRFDAMRSIQKSTSTFKKYSALAMSVIAFGILWCLGAVGFWQAEQKSQGLTYFQALYFCYVSLLTIGYGDLSPSSNAGKPFFIVWSLVAVPTMTILISDMGDTVIGSFKRGTFTLADWTVLPKAGLWRSFLERHPRLWSWLQDKTEEAEEEKRITRSSPIGPAGENEHSTPTLEQITELDALDQHALARQLGLAIRETANDLRADHPVRYSYEEWAKYTRLIRFSRLTRAELEEEEEEQGLIEWDWIGEHSPMLAEGTESEWLLDRLCESLDRYMWRQDRNHKTMARNRSRQETRTSSKANGVTQAPCSD
ncbi:MAG: hypothetical protein Q9221_005116 [Calogaya cf. arnoldii]